MKKITLNNTPGLGVVPDQASIEQYLVYHTQIKNLGYEDYVQVSITADEFAKLEDRIEFISEGEMDKLEERDEEWLKDQYNRNRSTEDHLK